VRLSLKIKDFGGISACRWQEKKSLDSLYGLVIRQVMRGCQPFRRLVAMEITFGEMGGREGYKVTPA
jgi:hypothetical protein